MLGKVPYFEHDSRFKFNPNDTLRAANMPCFVDSFHQDFAVQRLLKGKETGRPAPQSQIKAIIFQELVQGKIAQGTMGNPCI